MCLQAVLFVLCCLPLQAPYEGWLEHMEQETDKLQSQKHLGNSLALSDF